jgi:uncharacterized protein YbjT (DUF2867 family)
VVELIQIALFIQAAMIAVIGAGGATGLECVRKLVASGQAVRAVVRSIAKYDGKFEKAEVVQGDVTDVESLTKAFSGCKTVVFAASASAYRGAGGPYEVDYLGVQKTVEAAKAAGVEKLVLISSRLVNPKKRFHPIRIILNNIKYSLMDYKFMGEEFLRGCGLEYTIVRPGGLQGGEGGTGMKPRADPGTEYILAAGPEGDVGKATSIHRTDVASVVAEAVNSPEAKGKTIEIVARPREDSDPAFDDHLKAIFKSIPLDAVAQ